ncbi:MAG: gluconokinase [Caldilineaceae bacterium]
MPSPLILALDIGTTSTRALLFNDQGRALPDCIAQVANHLQTTADGGAVFDAEHLFDNVVAAIDQALVMAGPRATQIAAVAGDTFVSNVLGVSTAGDPVTPVFTYADTRNATDTETLRAELDEATLRRSHDRTGCLLHTSYLPARFRWLERTHPDWLRGSVYWLSFGEYLYWKLLGRRVASYSVAAWTGLLNRRTLTWDEEWLSHLPIESEQLSPLGDVDAPLAGLLPPWGERWPVLKDVPWLPMIGDGAAANIGSGCDTPHRIALTIGTTGAMRVVLPPNIPTVPAGLWLYRVTRDRGLLGGATTEGGNLFAWLRESLQLPPAEQLEKELAERPPAAHGLTVLPFVAGERAPGWKGSARASLVGFTLNTRPVDIVQAALEGIAYRFAIIYGRIKPHLGAGNQQIIASGGGFLRSPAWLQIMADVLNQPIIALAEPELTSRGVALLALEYLSVIERPSVLSVETGQTYLPNLERHQRHQVAVTEQIAIYERLLGQ